MAKWCSGCQQEKDESEFGKQRKSPTGLQSRCKPCHAAGVRAAVRRHPETRRQWRAQWSDEQRAEANRQSAEAHRKQALRDPLHVRLADMQKQARWQWRKAGLPVEDFQYRDVLERDGWVCYLCGGVVLLCSLGFDHVIPKSKGGPHSFENVRVCHIRCNSSKGAKHAANARWRGSFYAGDPQWCYRKECPHHAQPSG